MTRREFPYGVKKAALERCLRAFSMRTGFLMMYPVCEKCGKQILGMPEYDHIQPDGLGGMPTLDNCQVLCGACHRQKTHTEDRPIMAKADRIRAKARGITKQKRAWPKGRKFGQ